MTALTPALARTWAKWAALQGHHDKAAAWTKWADEQERPAFVDGKMKAAGE